MGLNSWSRTIDKRSRVIEMVRAMAAQQLGTLGTAPGPGQIGVQSLEDQLYILTFGDAEMKLLQDLQSRPAFNWIHEFNVLQYYGSSVGAAVGAAALPPVDQAYFKRGWVEIKWFIKTKMIPQQMLEIESAVGNLVGVETRNALMMLLGQVDHAGYWGNSSLNPFEFDGIYAQVQAVQPNNVIDLRGAPLDPGWLEKGALLIRENWGNPAFAKLYAPPAVITPFTISYIPNQRAIPMLWEGGAGNPFGYWDTQYGRIYLRDDRFAERDPFNGVAPLQSLQFVPQGLPPTPTVAPTVGTPAADPNSQFNATTPGGYVSYAYAYRNSVGLSMVSPPSTPVQVQNGQSVQITIPTAGVNPPPSSIVIYRQGPLSSNFTPNLSQFQFMTEIPATISVSGTTYTDENNDLPGTYTAFLVTTSADGAHFVRLGDVERFDLAPINMAYWFAVTWYGALVVPAAQWHVIFKNVGGAQVGTPVTAGYAA
jgi:hypothetical protein